jgi:hypothetical protein
MMSSARRKVRFGFTTSILLVLVSSSAAGAAAGSFRPSSVSAEHAIYAKLDDALDLVGVPSVNSAGALTWHAVADTDSGTIHCAPQIASQFRCEWNAKLVQSYQGTARVTYHGRAARTVFTSSTCENPTSKGIALPNLCAIDPVPGMPNYGA